MAADKNFIVSTGSSGDDIAADDKENVFGVGDVAVDDMNLIVFNGDDDKENVFGVFNDVAVFYYFWC